jgi:Cu(I)/Ag(I) efflux system protein CusF
MKALAILSLIIIMFASGLSIFQPDGMNVMDMDQQPYGPAGKATVHKTTGLVKEVDRAKGKVTLLHEPVASLKWPAMTMRFSIKDEPLFAKLIEGEKVDFEFVQEESDHVVTGVNQARF